MLLMKTSCHQTRIKGGAMQYRPKASMIPIVVLCLSAVPLLLTGSEKTQIRTPAPTVLSSEAVNVPQTRQAPSSFIVSPLDLNALTNDADAIVIGRVRSVEARGRANREVAGRTIEVQPKIANLAINRVIKGDIPTPELKFEFPILEHSLVYGDIELSRLAMYFLRKNEDGSYAVLNPNYPFLGVASDSILPEADALDRVVAVIGSPLKEPKSSLAERRLAVHLLRSGETESATAILRLAAKDSDPVVRLQALSALTARNDISMLKTVEDTLLHPKPGIEDYLLRNLSAALEGIKEPQAVSALNRLLRSSNVNVRLGAARALRRLHVSDAIDGLVLALEDSNREIRYEGVIGLAEQTGQLDWAPAIDTFWNDEQYYLQHWKAWAKSR